MHACDKSSTHSLIHPSIHPIHPIQNQASYLDPKLSKRILQQASSQLAEEEQAAATTAARSSTTIISSSSSHKKGKKKAAVSFQVGGKGAQMQMRRGGGGGSSSSSSSSSSEEEEEEEEGEEQDDMGPWDEEEEEYDGDMVEFKDGAVHSLARCEGGKWLGLDGSVGWFAGGGVNLLMLVCMCVYVLGWREGVVWW
jgi:hypothetical protein